MTRESKLPVLWGVYVKARSREHAEALHQDISTYIFNVLGVRPMIVIMRSLPPEIEAQEVRDATLAAHGPDGGHGVIAKELVNQSWMPWQPDESVAMQESSKDQAKLVDPPHVCQPIQLPPMAHRQWILVVMLWLMVMALGVFLWR